MLLLLLSLMSTTSSFDCFIFRVRYLKILRTKNRSFEKWKEETAKNRRRRRRGRRENKAHIWLVSSLWMECSTMFAHFSFQHPLKYQHLIRPTLHITVVLLTACVILLVECARNEFSLWQFMSALVSTFRFRHRYSIASSIHPQWTARNIFLFFVSLRIFYFFVFHYTISVVLLRCCRSILIHSEEEKNGQQKFSVKASEKSHPFNEMFSQLCKFGLNKNNEHQQRQQQCKTNSTTTTTTTK